MKIKYQTNNFRDATLLIIQQANTIIEEYQAQGYSLTLRQLYYQFVSRDLIKNKQEEYDRLGRIISEARRAGLIDWDAIVDRTREMEKPSSWESPEDIIETAANGFRIDLWATQPHYVEVWFEKDALLGVFERAALTYRLPLLSCRGYGSDSTYHEAAKRFIDIENGALYYGPNPRKVIVLHFGDHDPSGLDMSRDIEARFNLFEAFPEVRRLALNMAQVRRYRPPPNPAKETDSRFANYRDEFGTESWELDALNPDILAKLVNDEVAKLIEHKAWDAALDKEKGYIKELKLISEHYQIAVKAVTEEEEKD